MTLDQSQLEREIQFSSRRVVLNSVVRVLPAKFLLSIVDVGAFTSKKSPEKRRMVNKSKSQLIPLTVRLLHSRLINPVRFSSLERTVLTKQELLVLKRWTEQISLSQFKPVSSYNPHLVQLCSDWSKRVTPASRFPKIIRCLRIAKTYTDILFPSFHLGVGSSELSHNAITKV